MTFYCKIFDETLKVYKKKGDELYLTSSNGKRVKHSVCFVVEMMKTGIWKQIKDDEQ